MKEEKVNIFLRRRGVQLCNKDTRLRRKWVFESMRREYCKTSTGETKPSDYTWIQGEMSGDMVKEMKWTGHCPDGRVFECTIREQPVPERHL